jgi:hypothetical protein
MIFPLFDFALDTALMLWMVVMVIKYPPTSPHIEPKPTAADRTGHNVVSIINGNSALFYLPKGK